MSGPNQQSRPLVSDEVAYALPMGVFLLLTWVGGSWPSTYPWTYAVKTILTAILLWKFWPHYTKVSWRFVWLGVLVGILGIVQWVGMEMLVVRVWPNYPRMSHDPYIPWDHFHSAASAWSFIAVRWAGASLVVPVMEELFWRDFLWRSFLAPNDFKLATVGEWDWRTVLTVAVIFGAGVHVEWMTAIVWGLLIGWLLIRTKSLGACIIAHGVTNFLLGAYVLYSGKWGFW